MATDDLYVLLYNKKLLPFDQMKSGLMDYMLKAIRATHQDIFPNDNTIGSVVVTVVANTNNKIDIAKLAGFRAATGNGRTIALSAADSRLQAVPIPPSAGTVFHIGLEQNDVETGIEINSRTGKFQYVSYLEQLGRVGQPTSVVDNGNGTITINVNSLVESGFDYSGRQVRVWLKSFENGGLGPQSSSGSVAIQTLVIGYGAPNNTILVPNAMGQSSISTDVTKYVIQLIGPTVKRLVTEDLRSTAGCYFLAAVTSVASGNPIVTISTVDQRLFSLNNSSLVLDNLTANISITDLGTLAVSGASSFGGHLVVSSGGIDVTGGLSVNAGGVNVITGQAVSIQGASTLSVGSGGSPGLLTANGGITVPTGQSVVLSGNTGLTVGTNGLTDNGAATITGLLSANGGIAVPTAKTVTLNGTTTLTVGTGTTTLGGDLAVTGNETVANVTATGTVKDGLTRTYPVFIQTGINPTPPTYNFNVVSGVPAATGFQPASYAANGGTAWPIHGIPVGKKITAVRIKITDNTSQTLTIRLAAMTQPATATPSWATIATGNTSNGTGAIQLLTATGINHPVTTFELLTLVVFSATGITSPIIWMGEVDAVDN